MLETRDQGGGSLKAAKKAVIKNLPYPRDLARGAFLGKNARPTVERGLRIVGCATQTLHLSGSVTIQQGPGRSCLFTELFSGPQTLSKVIRSCSLTSHPRARLMLQELPE